MRDHAAVIVGGGPIGLMLAGGLALADVDVAIVERRVSQDLIGSRPGGLHARSICSISAGSPTGSSQRDRWRSRGLRAQDVLDTARDLAALVDQAGNGVLAFGPSVTKGVITRAVRRTERYLPCRELMKKLLASYGGGLFDRINILNARGIAALG